MYKRQGDSCSLREGDQGLFRAECVGQQRRNRAQERIIRACLGPFPDIPIYCAAKAGVHSFTQSLRVELKHTRIKVFELAPPATRTPLLTGEFDADDVKGGPVMDIARLASQTINGLKKDQLEIRPGLSNLPVARLRRVSYNCLLYTSRCV